MGIVLYTTSVSSNETIKSRQRKIIMTLQSMKIEFTEIDISLENTTGKDDMRRISGNATQLPPYICNGELKCGDFDAFEMAVDDKNLDDFLKGTPN